MTSPPPLPEEPAGEGLQSERTYLAWQRTGLTFLAAGALLVHAVGGLQHPFSIIPGLFGMAVSAVIFARGLLRYRLTSAAAVRGHTVAEPVGLLAVAVAASVLSVSGLFVVLLSL